MLSYLPHRCSELHGIRAAAMPHFREQVRMHVTGHESSMQQGCVPLTAFYSPDSHTICTVLDLKAIKKCLHTMRLDECTYRMKADTPKLSLSSGIPDHIWLQIGAGLGLALMRNQPMANGRGCLIFQRIVTWL